MTQPPIDIAERFFDLSLDLLCCLGFDGRFRRLSPSWERVLGYTREELTSRPFIDFVHPDDRERTLAQNREVRAGGQARSFLNRYRRADGTYRSFRWNATPDLEHQVIYSVARDVTEQVMADEEIERLVTELRAAAAEVRELQDILPICSYCKKIRDDENYWHAVEAYIARRTRARFSHSICPSCYEQHVVPQLREDDRGDGSG